MITSVNLRPSIGMLYNMRHMNYEQSFALAEFVDNSIQSFLDNEDQIKSIHGETVTLVVHIILANDTLHIIDNAGGINEQDYRRAFSAGERPPGVAGLSEFGMGMKAAACWYANNWEIKTTALGEPVLRTVSCDMTDIVNSETEEVEVESESVDPQSHFTGILLSNLLQKPYGRGYVKIQEYLSSIYRLFLQTGQLQLYCFNKFLSYPDATEILHAPHYSEMAGYDHIDDVPERLKREWKTAIDFELQGIRVSGFAALRGRGVARGAGFSLFRNRRLIVENYLPPEIFGSPNSGITQRLFGELHIEGVGVSFAKDSFNWNENLENDVVETLKELLSLEISQARHFPYNTLHPKPESVHEPTPESVYEPTPEPVHEPTPEPELPIVDFVMVRFQGKEWQIDLDTPLIYFIKLPVGDVIKIGITKSVRLLNQRRSGAQTYFVEDVNFLGVQPFEVGHDPESDEQELLDRFGRANTERSECELVQDTPEVRAYIEENCDPADPYLQAIRRS